MTVLGIVTLCIGILLAVNVAFVACMVLRAAHLGRFRERYQNTGEGQPEWLSGAGGGADFVFHEGGDN